MSYPFLLRVDGSDFFPAAYAHLLGKTLSRPQKDLDTNLACFNLANASTKNTWSVALKVSLPSYATEITKAVSLAPASSQVECVNPVINGSALYALMATMPSVVTASVTDPATGTTITSDNHSCTIEPANMDYFKGNGPVELWDYSAVFSMPDSPSIGPVLTAAKDRSTLPGQFGVVPYDRAGQWFNPRTTSVDVNTYKYWPVFAEAAEPISFFLQQVSGGTSDDVDLFLFDNQSFETWKGGGTASAIKVVAAAVTGAQIDFTPSAADWYVFVVRNPNANWVSRDISYQRLVTRADVAFDVMGSIFTELKSRGLSYVSIGGNFYDGAQRIRWPAESLSDGAANCIDGSLLFASVAELAGVDPVLIFVPGHAFFGVRARAVNATPGTGRLWPIETTGMGSSDAVTAINCALQDCVIPNPAWKKTVEIVKVRPQGITPIPR